MSASAAAPPPASRSRDQSWRQQPQHRSSVNAYERHRYQQRQAGTWAPFTATAPVRGYIERLRDAGMTCERIAHASGVSVSTLTRMAKVSRMTAVAAHAILAIPMPDPTPDGRHSITEQPLNATHQLRALVADGWSLTQLADAAGLNDRTVSQTVHGHTTPSPRTIKAVDALYERLRLDDPGDSATAVRARLRAQRHGWIASTTDPEPRNGTASSVDTSGFTPPDEIVDDVAVDRVVTHGARSVLVPLRPHEQRAALRQLAGTQPDDEIAHRLGVATRTVSRHRASQGLPAYEQWAPPTGPTR